MRSPLEDVEFLARSENRVEVLEALNGDARTRDDLKQTTEASRTTLSRMLADFEDRGWIDRSGDSYELTPEGRFVVEEVTRLLENMETAEKLDGSLAWLPTGEFEFDLRRLDDAEVVTLQWNDPASMRALAHQLEGASEVRSIATSVSRDVVDILRKVTIENDAAYEGILTEDAVETVREHPELRRQLREILDRDHTTVYRYDGDDTLAMVMLIDGKATLCNHGSGGPQMEAIISDDEAFRSWVGSYFASVRDEAAPLQPDSFAE